MRINESILAAFRQTLQDVESAEELDNVLDEIPENYQDELSDEIADKKSELLSALEDASAAEVLQRVKEDEFLQELIRDSDIFQDEGSANSGDAPESEPEAAQDGAEDEPGASEDETDPDEDEPEGGEGEADSDEDEPKASEDEPGGDEDEPEGGEGEAELDEEGDSPDQTGADDGEPEDALDSEQVLEDTEIGDEHDFSQFLDRLPIEEGVAAKIQDRVDEGSALDDSTCATLLDAAEELGVDTESIEDSDPSNVIAALRQKAERLDGNGSQSPESSINDLDVIRAHWLG
jgi:hypothetical protein